MSFAKYAAPRSGFGSASMQRLEIDAPRVHDLLQIDHAWRTLGCVAEPAWVREALIACPWVVVRRAQPPLGQVAVGVRGATRSERWGAVCPESVVRKIVRPEELVLVSHPPDVVQRTPALRGLKQMAARWADLTLAWGPAGSVAFELATGHRVTTQTSDLDLVIRAPRRIGVEEARRLFECTIGLEARVDVRVETPVCGFSLEEYASASTTFASILLRCRNETRLGADPWLAADERPHVVEQVGS